MTKTECANIRIENNIHDLNFKTGELRRDVIEIAKAVKKIGEYLMQEEIAKLKIDRVI